jgi:chromatin remodeling complex protein RSC6
MTDNELICSVKPNSPSDKLISKIESLEIALITLKKGLEIAVNEIKCIKKQSKKLLSKKEQKKKDNIEKKPHGFAIPSKVSNELCIFMGREPNSLIARTEVTKKLTEYITEHKLQNPEKKIQIIPDLKLLNLLGEEAKDVLLTHFTIQKYMNHHFEKKNK